jgi:ribosomal protein S18 acetylase RimI-like enzyme
MSPAPVWDTQPLTRAIVEQHVDRLIELDTELIGERWTADHWMRDLPGKWELSRIALADETIVAYLVASRKNEAVHYHRLAVAPEMHRMGLGSALMREIAGAAARAGIPELSTKVHKTNARAEQFVRSLGFRVAADDGVHLLFTAPAEAVAPASG